MKNKILSFVLILAMFTGCSSSSTTVGDMEIDDYLESRIGFVDKNGKIYGYANFDIYTNVQTPILGSIEYSIIKGFDYKYLYKSLKDIKADVIKYKIYGKIIISDLTTTENVYVTFGEDIQFHDSAVLPRTQGAKIMGAKPKVHTDFMLEVKINNQVLALDDILAKVKHDAYGNRYVDYEISFDIKFIEDSENLTYAKSQAYELVTTYFSKYLNRIRFMVAPESRMYKNQYYLPEVYMLDEK